MTIAIIITILLLVLFGVSMTINKAVSGPGINAGQTVTITDDADVGASPTILAAQPGVLTVRTNGTSGSLTMTNSSHGIVTGQRVDLYWTGGQCYGAVVGTVAGTVVPIASVSGGTALPIATTAMIVGICISAPFAVTGNNVVALAMSSPSCSGYFVFNNGSADIYALYVPAGYVPTWNSGDAGTNPLASATPTLVYISHSDITVAHQDMIAVAIT